MEMPVPLEGFEQVRRRWDARERRAVAKILPGEVYVTRHAEQITTVLGSCVAACIRDRAAGIGGMNHFMLPESTAGPGQSADAAAPLVGMDTCYGNFAMEHLINSILRHGGNRKNLEVKLFGGGKVLPSLSDVGLRNIGFVLDYIDTEGLRLMAQDLGDIYPRKVVYFPASGRARVKKLKSLHGGRIGRQELDYREQIRRTPAAGEVELF